MRSRRTSAARKEGAWAGARKCALKVLEILTNGREPSPPPTSGGPVEASESEGPTESSKLLSAATERRPREAGYLASAVKSNLHSSPPPTSGGPVEAPAVSVNSRPY